VRIGCSIIAPYINPASPANRRAHQIVNMAAIALLAEDFANQVSSHGWSGALI
jgi:hypothetical protein